MFICDISIFNRYGKQCLDDMLAPQGADWRRLVVILVISQVPGISQTRLSPFLQTDKANVTKLLQTMEKEGHLRRESHPEDQRNKTCHLTQKGKDLVPFLEKTLSAWEGICFEGLSAEDLARFQEYSRIITKNLVPYWGEAPR